MKRRFAILLVILSSSYFNVQSQVIRYTRTDTESIIIPESECVKNSIFIFVKEESSNKITNSLMESISLLNFLNKIDTANFIINIVEIRSKSLSCALKSLSIDDYELPSYFNYDPYYICIHPKKNFEKLMNLRLDSMTSIGNYIPNIENRNSPFINIKDYINFIKLVRLPSDFELIEKMQIEIIKLKKELLNVNSKIDSMISAKKILKGSY